MKLIVLVTVVLLAFLSIAEGLSRTYEFPPPDGLEGDSAIVQLNKDDEGNYLATVTVAEETIEGENVVVGEDLFSFDIVVETPDGDMSQAYTVKLDEEEFTLSIQSEHGDLSRSISLKGTPVNEIEGTYTFPPEVDQGDTITIHLAKDDDDDFSVMVTVGDETFEEKNVVVSGNQFSFNTKVKTQIEEMFQAWKVEVTNGEATLSILADIGGQSVSLTLKGNQVDEQGESEN